jgi:RNA polymerase sigma-70 factor (ECF subfamily)
VRATRATRRSDAVHHRTDDELLRAVGGGDRAAFDEFHRRTAPWLALRLRRRCRDDEVVADVLQETFLSVWRSAAGYAGTDRSGGWVWMIASRKLVDAYRRRGAADSLTLDADIERAATVSPSAEEEMLVNTYDPDLATALSSLSPELRQVLQVTVLDGLSTREAAVLLGVPEGTVKARAFRARRSLRAALS